MNKLTERIGEFLLLEDYDNERVFDTVLPVKLALQVNGDANGAEPTVTMAITCSVDGVSFVPVATLTCGEAAPDLGGGGDLGDLGGGEDLGGGDFAGLDLGEAKDDEEKEEKGDKEKDDDKGEKKEKKKSSKKKETKGVGGKGWKEGEDLCAFIHANVEDEALADALCKGKFINEAKQMWKDARKTAELIAERNKNGEITPEPLKPEGGALGLPPVDADATFAPVGDMGGDGGLPPLDDAGGLPESRRRRFRRIT